MESIALERPTGQSLGGDTAQTSASAGRLSDVAIAFLQRIGPHDRHNLFAIVPDGPVAGRTFEAGAWPEMADWIDARHATANIYFSANVPRPGAPHDKLRKTDIEAIRMISVDQDTKAGTAEECAALLETLKKAVQEEGLPRPSIVVDTGNGYQSHWLLDEKVAADRLTEWAEGQSRAFALKVQGDDTQNIDRILRLPGTFNLPKQKKRTLGRTTRPTKILNQLPVRYKPTELSSAVPPVARKRDDSDLEGLDARIAEVRDDIDCSGWDSNHSFDDLDVGTRSKLEGARLADPVLNDLLAGGLPEGADDSGSGYRLRLAARLGRLGTFDAVEFASICHAWSHAHGANALTARLVARDWVRIGEAPLRLIAQHAESSETVGNADAAPSSAGNAAALLPTPYGFPLSAAISPRQWIYGSHLIRRFISATVAPGGLGKSSLTIVEAMAMATGKPLLGVRPRGQFRVWLWNGEDPIDELYRRINAAIQHYRLTEADFGGRLFVDSGRQRPITLAGQTKDGAVINGPVRAALLAGLRERQVDALFIDPFISSHRVTENDNNAIDIVAKAWGGIADEADIAIELVHHVRKTNGAEVTVEDARGAGSLVNAARSVRALNRMTAEEATKLQIDGDHRLFFRFGGDPKANLAPPPATDDTQWMAMRSVPLGNGTPDYPLGDSVGVVESFKPVRTFEEAQVEAANSERMLVAHAVLAALAGEVEAALSDLLPDIIKGLNAAGVTRSSAPHVTRDKVTAALAPQGGVVVEHDGQLVRLRAIRAGGGPKAPWQIRLDNVSEAEDASDANPSVFA